MWGIPLEANTGKVTGAPYRITEGPAVTENPAISEDGGRLLYDAQRNGGQQVLVRDLGTGAERAVAGGPLGATAGRWLPGGRIAYRMRTQNGSDAYVLDLVNGEVRKLAAGATLSDCRGETALLESGGGVDALNLKRSRGLPSCVPPRIPASAGRPVAGVRFRRPASYTATTHGSEEIRQSRGSWWRMRQGRALP